MRAERSIRPLSGPLDEFQQLVRGRVHHGVALRVDDVALHLAALPAEKAHEILLGKRVVVFGESSKIAILVDAFSVERASQVPHHGRVERDLAQFAASVRVGLEQHVRIRLDKNSHGQLPHA